MTGSRVLGHPLWSFITDPTTRALYGDVLARVLFTEVPLLEILPNEAPRDFVRRRTQAQRLVSVTPDRLDVRLLQPEEAARITRERGLSPDGKWMVYSKQVDGVTGLYLRDQASGTDRLLDRGGQE